MEGFLKGFTISPKPIRGLESRVIDEIFYTDMPIRELLIALTSAAGLASWLGVTEEFIPHVGIKLKTKINDQELQGVITAFELPKRIVFVFEQLGELNFEIKQSASQTTVGLKVSRSLLPSEEQGWLEMVNQVLVSLRSVFGTR